MPTITTTPAHRLAALIAVERDAADRFRKASRDIVLKALSFDPRSDEYRTADAEETAAFRALLAAQVEVDNALGSLSYPGGEVMRLA